MEWIRDKRWVNRERIDYKLLHEVEQQAKTLLKKKDFQEVTKLLKEYRNSYEAIEIIVYNIKNKDLETTLKDSENRDKKEMLETIKNTFFWDMVRCCSNTDEVKNTHYIDILLAQYTFMLDAYLERHPEIEIQRPEPTEVYAAKQIINELPQSKEIEELYKYHLYLTRPSIFVAERYGLQADFEKLDVLEPQYYLGSLGNTEKERIGDCLAVVEERLERNTIKAMENFPGFGPDAYLEKLYDDRERLGLIAEYPNKIHEISYYDLFGRYDIKSNAPLSQQLEQIEAAYRSVDARFSRLANRKPRADEFFARIKQKMLTTENRHQIEPQKKSTQKPKGKKLSF